MVTDIPKCSDCDTEVDQEGRDLLRDLFAGHVRHVFDEFVIKRTERLGTWPTAPNVDQMIEIIVSETLMPMCPKCFLERHERSNITEWATEALAAPEDSPLFFEWSDITDKIPDV